MRELWMKRHVLLLGLILGTQVWAHPVAYKGAFSFMALNQKDMLDWQLLYSFERNLSFGLDFIHDTMEGPDRYFLIPRLSWLVHRWNEKDSQANIYVYGGAGVGKMDLGYRTAAEGALEADYETREIYFSGKATVVAAKDFKTLDVYQLRAGFAPYVGEFDSLHSWLIGQVQYVPSSNDEQWRVGPVVRLFYRNVLTELGVSAKGSWNINFMVHW